jgi:hypothetical protein
MMPEETNNTITVPPDKEVTLIEVFVDDFVGATNKIDTPHLLKLSRSMLHGVHSIPPPMKSRNTLVGTLLRNKK